MAGSPFLRTTQSSHTRGAIAKAKDAQTKVVTRRSVAARLPSTIRDHSGIATTYTTNDTRSQFTRPQPARIAGRPATARAIATPSPGAQRGRRALAMFIDAPLIGRASEHDGRSTSGL